MAALLYQKEYAVNEFNGTYLKNPEQALAYCDEMFKSLVFNYQLPNQHQIKKKLFSDFRLVFEYDNENAIAPEPFGSFDTDAEKKECSRIH